PSVAGNRSPRFQFAQQGALAPTPALATHFGWPFRSAPACGSGVQPFGWNRNHARPSVAGNRSPRFQFAQQGVLAPTPALSTHFRCPQQEALAPTPALAPHFGRPQQGALAPTPALATHFGWRQQGALAPTPALATHFGWRQQGALAPTPALASHFGWRQQGALAPTPGFARSRTSSGSRSPSARRPLVSLS